MADGAGCHGDHEQDEEAPCLVDAEALEEARAEKERHHAGEGADGVAQPEVAAADARGDGIRHPVAPGDAGHLAEGGGDRQEREEQRQLALGGQRQEGGEGDRQPQVAAHRGAPDAQCLAMPEAPQRPGCHQLEELAERRDRRQKTQGPGPGAQAQREARQHHPGGEGGLDGRRGAFQNRESQSVARNEGGLEAGDGERHRGAPIESKREASRIYPGRKRPNVPRWLEYSRANNEL